ncbi:magnesium transporter CorA family protein [Phaeovulum sp. NW3]|uniref:magnesium transporter CorA family protein n=1 Tax=Phaeovulum sp. NW3 TaxID=2934933 RepID=UPI0020216987|nr:magnesium transporter CorA family protein [Phaeovulum sp. NW3]MCL7465689.1 magnesium transporter CorA family protein [Phaeovulum sp. NW3]
MMHCYSSGPGGLIRLDPDADPAAAVWIDLQAPAPEEVAALARLGVEVPSLADMEEIEISNRLYRESGADVMTVVLPGRAPDDRQIAGPVSFILTEGRLVTVRHHAPRSFDTFPLRADRSAAGIAGAEQIFMGLIEEIVARLADILEGVGRALDAVSSAVLGGRGQTSGQLQGALEKIGQQGEVLGRVRLALLTLERALSFFAQTLAPRAQGKELRAIVEGQMRDIRSLNEHGDFLSARLSLNVDATLGMINLAQNNTVRLVTVVAAPFVPPTLIASIYGMNFARMPELAHPWGYPVTLVLMLASAVGTWAFFKWKDWI